jgi:hypothetical protein
VAPAAHPSGPTRRPLEQGPPRSRAHAPSRGFRLARGLTPPRARSASLEGSRPLERVPPRSKAHTPSSGLRLARGPPPPRAGSASLGGPSRAHLLRHMGMNIKCSDTAELRHYAPGNHASALFRQLPRGSPPPPLWGTVRRGRYQLRDTVPPTLVRLTLRALEGGPVAPSNPLLVAPQGQTVTSGRRERHPRCCQSCAAIPAPAAPRRALLQLLRHCWARGDGMPPRPPLYPVRITVDGSLEPTWRRPGQPLRLYPRNRPCSGTGHAATP